MSSRKKNIEINPKKPLSEVFKDMAKAKDHINKKLKQGKGEDLKKFKFVKPV